MKKLVYMAFAAALLLTGCKEKEASVAVKISNPIALDRTECVAVSYAKIAELLPGLTDTTVVVCDAEGNEVPSQIYYNGETPLQIFFQPTVAGNSSAEYTVKCGTPAEYESKTFGRYVPERKDDYSWENNVIAFRSYGTALEVEMVSPGIDVWVKSSDKLVINEWVAAEQQEAGWYHHNHGDGLDCYKVGVTLGAGASAPYVDGKLIFPEHNWQKYTEIANGPLIKAFALTYPAYNIDGKEISLTKMYEIEANSNFCYVTDVYSAEADGLTIAAGTIRHNVKDFAQGDDWYAIYEEASDSSDPARDGDIALAMILPGADEVIAEGDRGHALMTAKGVLDEECGDVHFEYIIGAGWSQGNVPNAETWEKMVADKALAEANPLQTEIVK